MDVDLDGLEDVLITNGFSFDTMDIDSKNRVIAIQKARRLSAAELKRLRKYRPRLAKCQRRFPKPRRPEV